MICPRPNTHDPSPTAVPIKEAIKVFMPRPQLFIRQKPQFRSIRVPLFCRDPSPSHVTVAKSPLHSPTRSRAKTPPTIHTPPLARRTQAEIGSSDRKSTRLNSSHLGI